jgi:hypothetical protein
MLGIATFLLFTIALGASLLTLVASVRPQLHRFAELFGTPQPLTPYRLSRVTARAVPARMPRRHPLRAAA